MSKFLGKDYGGYVQGLINYQFEQKTPLLVTDYLVPRDDFRTGEGSLDVLFDVPSRNDQSALKMTRHELYDHIAAQQAHEASESHVEKAERTSKFYIKASALNMTRLYGKNQEDLTDSRIQKVIAALYAASPDVQCSIMDVKYKENGEFRDDKSMIFFAMHPNSLDGTGDIDHKAAADITAKFFAELVKNKLVTRDQLYDNGIMLGKNEAAISSLLSAPAAKETKPAKSQL